MEAVREYREKMFIEFFEKNHRFPTIGFVPTMGALHEGHLSLIKRVCIVWHFSSIGSWGKWHCDGQYLCQPQTIRSSWRFCCLSSHFGEGLCSHRVCRWRNITRITIRGVGCDAVFAPTDAIMYPEEPKYLTYVTIEGSDELSEGAARPGFFRGVATVVTKLFNIVQPTKSYFGQKDGLQAIMVQQFVRDLNIPVQICVCPIVRAVDSYLPQKSYLGGRIGFIVAQCLSFSRRENCLYCSLQVPLRLPDCLRGRWAWYCHSLWNYKGIFIFWNNYWKLHTMWCNHVMYRLHSPRNLCSISIIWVLQMLSQPRNWPVKLPSPCERMVFLCRLLPGLVLLVWLTISSFTRFWKPTRFDVCCKIAIIQTNG